ncbi:MAG: NADH-quinone oxidoreductase subunit J family protein [Candidatus Zixiibacteriota bacterium]
MTIDGFIFLVSAAVAVFGAIMMIAQRNAVASVLYFILSLVAQAVLYVQLGALFVSAILIIVYSGAILVLFLFVIMLLNLRGDEDLGKPSPPLSNITKALVAGGIVLEFGFIIKSSIFARAVPTGVMGGVATEFGSAEQVATLLFTRYLYPFELTSILLLAAIVGAVIIARRERGEESMVEQKVGVTKKSEMTVDEATG